MVFFLYFSLCHYLHVLFGFVHRHLFMFRADRHVQLQSLSQMPYLQLAKDQMLRMRVQYGAQTVHSCHPIFERDHSLGSISQGILVLDFTRHPRDLFRNQYVENASLAKLENHNCATLHTIYLWHLFRLYYTTIYQGKMSWFILKKSRVIKSAYLKSSSYCASV